MSDFGKKVLQRIKFWTETDLYKNRIWWIFAFRKPILDLFNPWKRQFCIYLLSQKPPIGENHGRKNISPIETFEKNQILKQCFNNASDFESRVSNALDSEPFFHNSKNFESKVLELVIFRKKNVLHRIRFWSGIDLYKNRFWWMFCFQKINFGSSYTTKMPTFAVMRFLNNHQLVKERKKKQFSHQDFWKESDFETSF